MRRYTHPLNQGMHRARQQSRQHDIQESQVLLLELITTEPTVLQCFKIIESTCLSQGIFCRIGGEEVSPRFQRFLEDHYVPFCRSAIRAMFTYGFVPWRVRRLGKGDQIPEVLAPGTFSWHTEVGPEEQERNQSRRPIQNERQRLHACKPTSQRGNSESPAAGSSFSLQVTAAIPRSSSAFPSKNSRLHAPLRYVAVADGN